MYEIVKKVFRFVVQTFKRVIKTIAVIVLILNLALLADVSRLMTDLDAKTDMMVSAIQENRVPTLPNFEKLVRANVMIGNVTQGCGGSGTTINMNGKTYILSAGHLGEFTDTFFVKERDDFRSIKMVRQNKDVDLALFEYVGEYCDLTIASIATEEPKVGDRIWVVGNPAMLEDAITSGTLVRKMGYSYLIDAKIYYGSSGGGLFNVRGELIGVNVAMIGVQNYVLGCSVNLRTVKAFLLGNI